MNVTIAKISVLVIVFAFVVTMFSITYSTPELTTAQKQASAARVALHNLPDGASDVIVYDGIMSTVKWKTFKWHGQCFLIRSVGHSAVLTTINCSKEK